jgi:hypothetical protein
METKLKTIFFSIALSFCFATQAQTLIKFISATNTGPADTSGTYTIIRNSDSTISFAGNERINATQCNFKTMSLDSTNTTLTWTQVFNANIKKAYTTAATHDNVGNLIIVGCTYLILYINKT